MTKRGRRTGLTLRVRAAFAPQAEVQPVDGEDTNGSVTSLGFALATAWGPSSHVGAGWLRALLALSMSLGAGTTVAATLGNGSFEDTPPFLVQAPWVITGDEGGTPDRVEVTNKDLEFDVRYLFSPEPTDGTQMVRLGDPFSSQREGSANNVTLLQGFSTDGDEITFDARVFCDEGGEAFCTFTVRLAEDFGEGQREDINAPVEGLLVEDFGLVSGGEGDFFPGDINCTQLPCIVNMTDGLQDSLFAYHLASRFTGV